MRFITFEQFFAQLSKKEFLYYTIGLGFALTLLIGGTGYFYYKTRSDLYKRIKMINNQRIEIQKLIERLAIVQKEKDTVNTILNQEKDFKLADAFNKAVTKAGLENKKNRTEDVSTPEKVLPGYAEIRLNCSFEGIDMQQLTKLLQELEQNNRINTKELEIERYGNGLKVRVSVATLEPLTQAVE